MSAALLRSARRTRAAAGPLSLVQTETKNAALRAMAAAVRRDAASILRANAADVRAAEKKKTPPAMVARLRLDDKKIEGIARALENIADLADPVGRTLVERDRPNGLKIRKVSVPIGVILIIFESRPNVTADCMALCLKSGNAVLLKGGSEALNSNKALFRSLSAAAYQAGIPKGSFELVTVPGRAAVRALLGLDTLIDLVIPRGGESLIREVARLSKIPVIKHYKGICHTYVDREADLDKAVRIAVNAKAQNPSVCNAMETLLVHADVAAVFLPRVGRALDEKKVELRADAAARRYLPGARAATEKDWSTEYLDLILSIRVVRSLDEALAHIERYGSRHSETIVTENREAARRFTDAVDASAVFVNASTRFNDGGEFGMGAEMGISTDKLHARGPMGLEELTSYKYVVVGDGQIRS
jgi:glutamate-5-semialdehyde dehydrogenase